MRYLTAFLSSLLLSGEVFAQGKPTPGALGFQTPVTETARDAFSFHNGPLLWMCILITLFVAGLLGWVMFRYNAKTNPVPSKTTHNATLEVVWTLLPVVILVAIATISFPLLYKFDRAPNLQAIVSGEVNATVAEQAAASEGWVNVKAQGNQWNWTYSYPDVLDADGYSMEFTSSPIHVGLSTDPKQGEVYLSVDFPMVVPAGRYVRYYTAASDVIHSFAMPSFGIKTDAIPGRLNEGWFKVDEPGVYYGQCSELCGKNHAFMPIEIRVVPQAQYDAWLEIMRAGNLEAAAERVAQIDTAKPTRLAAAN